MTHTAGTPQSVFAEELDAWLTEVLGDHERQVITDHPWGQTFRVVAGPGTYFLKVVPAQQRAAFGAFPLLAARFPQVTPGVVALDADAGLVLFASHGGTEIGGAPSTHQQRRVLRTYAMMQADAATVPRIVEALPPCDPCAAAVAFREFLEQDGDEQDGDGLDLVGAAHFLGTQRAAYYRERFAIRAALLEPLLVASRQLPRTLNHGDLRCQNVAETTAGACVIFDWDEATSGPAGASLHNFFSGCSTPARLLLGLLTLDATNRYSRLLETYVTTLEEFGYASREALQRGLPGAICAGVLRYLTSYGKFPMPSAADREQVAGILVRRLDDLLVLCDALAAQERGTAIRCIDDYVNAGAQKAADSLLQACVRHYPDDAALHLRHAANLHAQGASAEAVHACRRALENDPLNSPVRRLLARILLDDLRFDDTLDHLRLARISDPNPETCRLWSEACELRGMQLQAAVAGAVPTVRFSDEEIATGKIASRKSRLALRMYRQYGTLLLENAFSPHLIANLAEAFTERYSPALAGGRPDASLRVGDKRFMLTVDVEGAFNAPQVYAPQLLAALLRRILGNDFILGSFTAVASLPGAADMRMHKDHPALFDKGELPEELPHFAVTTLVPLLGFDHVVGTTRVVKGSHRRSSDEASEMESQDPCAPAGACLLMDYRLSHQGLANRSTRVRPVLSLVYSRPWFRDSVNYAVQEPLRIRTEEFQRIPEELRPMFAWAIH